MIRPIEINFLVLNDIENRLCKCKYEAIELSEYKNYILVKAKKSYDGHLFEADVRYNDTTRIIHINVYCLTPVPKNKRIFCLKLLNYVGFFEEEAKYILCHDNHIILCSTVHSFLECRCSIGQLIESHASCSIENLSVIHDTIKNDDVKIGGIHPIRFHNDYWEGTN